MTDHTGMDSERMFGHAEKTPVFSTRRPPSTRLAMLATHVRLELNAIAQNDSTKRTIAADALKGMF